MSQGPPDFSKIPLAHPPPGVVPNFVNPPSILYKYTISASVTLGLMLVVLGLRLYTRGCITRQLWYDDFFLVIAALLAIMKLVCSTLMGRYGLGVHAWNVPLSKVESFLLLNFIEIIAYLCIVFFAKLGILGLYYRLNPFGKLRYVVIGTGIVVIAHTIGAVTGYLMLCSRMSDHWSIHNPVCHGSLLHWFQGSGLANILIDFFILSLPVFMLWNMNLPRNQKIIAALILMLGSVSCFLSIVRQVILMPAVTSVDPTYNTVKIAIISCMEGQIAIICACLPVLKPLFKRYFDRESQVMSPHEFNSPMGQISKEWRETCSEVTQTDRTTPSVECGEVYTNISRDRD